MTYSFHIHADCLQLQLQLLGCTTTSWAAPFRLAATRCGAGILASQTAHQYPNLSPICAYLIHHLDYILDLEMSDHVQTIDPIGV